MIRLLAIAIVAAAASFPSMGLAQVTKDVPVDGIVIHYSSAGEGRPLVLLHHFGWSGTVWEPFVSTLAKNHRVIIVDLPGHGGSTGWNEARYDYPRNSARIRQMLDAIGIREFDAIGASSGSVTLLQMAVAQPARIGRMILVSSTPVMAPQTIEWLNANACAPVTEDDIREGLPYQTHGREQVIGLAKMFCEERYNPLNITADQLKTITATTLVVHGDRDRIFPLSSPITEVANIPHAFLWVQPNAGHVFIFKPEHRQSFLDMATIFLSGAWK